MTSTEMFVEQRRTFNQFFSSKKGGEAYVRSACVQIEIGFCAVVHFSAVDCDIAKNGEIRDQTARMYILVMQKGPFSA